MDFNGLLHTLQTIAIFGGSLTFIWGVVKFVSKLGALQDLPIKVDAIKTQVEQVDRKVENLTGQFEVFKSYGGRR